MGGVLIHRSCVWNAQENWNFFRGGFHAWREYVIWGNWRLKGNNDCWTKIISKKHLYKCDSCNQWRKTIWQQFKYNCEHGFQWTVSKLCVNMMTRIKLWFPEYNETCLLQWAICLWFCLVLKACCFNSVRLIVQMFSARIIYMAKSETDCSMKEASFIISKKPEINTDHGHRLSKTFLTKF